MMEQTHSHVFTFVVHLFFLLSVRTVKFMQQYHGLRNSSWFYTNALCKGVKMQQACAVHPVVRLIYEENILYTLYGLDYTGCFHICHLSLFYIAGYVN